MRYGASWRYTSGFGVCVVVIEICFLSTGVLFHKVILVAIGFAAFLLAQPDVPSSMGDG